MNTDCNRKRILCVTTFIVLIGIVILNGVVVIKDTCIRECSDVYTTESFRKMSFIEKKMKSLYYIENGETGKRIIGLDENVLEDIIHESMYMSTFDLKNKVRCPLLFKILVDKDEYLKCYNVLYSLLSDIRYFPVAADTSGKVKTPYEDSWGGARSYGGSRSHEGTDIMAGNNQRGYFPIISMTDGIVENMGWLELGGYRIGVRSSSGAYYYYAHLCEYADGIAEGSAVKAGTILGTMGDTGYGKEEGTTGQFVVHLHMGMYCDVDGKEISYNPYYILKEAEKYRLDFVNYQQ